MGASHRAVGAPACSLHRHCIEVHLRQCGRRRRQSRVATSAGCTWQAASNATWIAVTSGSPGSGNGTAQFTVAKTPGATDYRTGTLTVAGQTITITQGTPTSAGSAPAFTAQALVNAASMQAGAVAPGEVDHHLRHKPRTRRDPESR